MMRRLLALLTIGALGFALAGCGSSTSPSQPVADRLQAAKAFIDNTKALNFSLSTTAVPKSATAVLSATGVGTHQPGFQGTIKVAFSGLPTNVPVVAVDGKVWAQIFGPWQVIDPKQYGAPDPAALMSTTTGISSLLTAATGLDKGKQTREGSSIVTTYTGSVTGAVVGTLIPIATASATFTVTFSLTADNHLEKATITGPFFEGAGNTTYSVTLTSCADCKPVVAPAS